MTWSPGAKLTSFKSFSSSSMQPWTSPMTITRLLLSGRTAYWSTSFCSFTSVSTIPHLRALRTQSFRPPTARGSLQRRADDVSGRTTVCLSSATETIGSPFHGLRTRSKAFGFGCTTNVRTVRGCSLTAAIMFLCELCRLLERTFLVSLFLGLCRRSRVRNRSGCDLSGSSVFSCTFRSARPRFSFALFSFPSLRTGAAARRLGFMEYTPLDTVMRALAYRVGFFRGFSCRPGFSFAARFAQTTANARAISRRHYTSIFSPRFTHRRTAP
mmetsp:Transcript_2269/g.6780  ORF Transcript_2269/g.6780 Transcript_2269/m.6780 type:complete len:270 (+) Transcript_2269:1372-2181(+)